MKHLVKLGLAAALAVASASSAALAQAPKTLDAVKARGTLSCGVGTGLAGVGQPDDKGAWTGLDVEFCRALAAAIFNDPQKVSFKPLSAKERFTALQSGEIDVLARNSTWTISRDSSLGLAFVEKSAERSKVAALVDAVAHNHTTNVITKTESWRVLNIRFWIFFFLAEPSSF